MKSLLWSIELLVEMPETKRRILTGISEKCGSRYSGAVRHPKRRAKSSMFPINQTEIGSTCRTNRAQLRRQLNCHLSNQIFHPTDKIRYRWKSNGVSKIHHQGKISKVTMMSMKQTSNHRRTLWTIRTRCSELNLSKLNHTTWVKRQNNPCRPLHLKGTPEVPPSQTLTTSASQDSKHQMPSWGCQMQAV